MEEMKYKMKNNLQVRHSAECRDGLGVFHTFCINGSAQFSMGQCITLEPAMIHRSNELTA